MKQFLGSKAFVIICTASTLVIGIIAGTLLGYQPNVSGYVSGYVTTSGRTYTQYVFQIKAAFGYWLFAVAIAFVVLLLTIIIRKHYTAQEPQTETNE